VSPGCCAAFVTVTPGREMRCGGAAGHGPAEDLLRVTLPNGREHAASLAWSTMPSPCEDDLLRRST
jgi:hypothetical protein